MSDSRKPTLDEIGEQLAAVVAGRLSRDDADPWARRWVLADDFAWDDLEWWALICMNSPSVSTVVRCRGCRLSLSSSPRLRLRCERRDELADHRQPDGTGWVVLADPEGNEFCVLRSAAEHQA